ncbi:hypothetical protein FisN_20Lu271 [Fistulifera solaris]|uniref:Vesicle transport protein n=1 Tax=Fistulifera solaris TaxID=1519565 RepID=A0A1Z5KRX6_FISSO|nr:hypothetical protein FisN_20Lu271 [Fistulifera solaris]|eukprot:GAX28947.1 hypothetical protein FisN_20Lu271 [Fistulifera solaris]
MSSSFIESSFDYQSLLPSRFRSDRLDVESIEEPVDETGEPCSCFPEMTWRERLLGCVTCMLCGYMLSIGSFWRIKDLVINHDPLPFVLNATIGNIIALAGSFFLTGPKAQWKNMWLEKRRIATGLYLGSLFLTLFVAFLPIPGPEGFYLLLLMLCQYISITWYTLSYVPFAHDIIVSFVRRRISVS